MLSAGLVWISEPGSLIVTRRWPVRASQITAESGVLVTTRRPSWLNAAVWISSTSLANTLPRWGAATSQIRATPVWPAVRPAVRMCRPSGLKATLSTAVSPAARTAYLPAARRVVYPGVAVLAPGGDGPAVGAEDGGVQRTVLTPEYVQGWALSTAGPCHPRSRLRVSCHPD